MSSGDTTADVRDMIERLRRGDDSARRELLERVSHRLHRIAASTLRKDFPDLRAHHEINSVVGEAWVQLLKALETTHPATAEDFYRLVFRKVRHVLLDMARRQRREEARMEDRPNSSASDYNAAYEVGDTTYEPSRLAFWTEIHREVARLPEDQRSVFRFHYFAELPQSEIARLLDLPPKKVSRLWLAATMRLAQRLGGIEELIS
jgi:RNA polymerase sigma factor (sigma-70 family)